MTNEPYVSPEFNMEDILRIRDYNSAQHTKMIAEEVIADYKNGSDKLIELLAERKAKTMNNSTN